MTDTFSNDDGHFGDGEVIAASHIETEPHESRLAIGCVHFGSVSVVLIGQLLVEVVIVDDKTETTTLVSKVVFVEDTGNCGGFRDTSRKQET